MYFAIDTLETPFGDEWGWFRMEKIILSKTVFVIFC
jgi:hypothetical protein